MNNENEEEEEEEEEEEIHYIRSYSTHVCHGEVLCLRISALTFEEKIIDCC
jgi:hypothetical protein